MKENNLSQLVGALGGWLEARPYGVEQDALDRAARIVLDMRLLGVDIDDVDAPELAALDPEDRDVVDQARTWAQARREEARRRRAADERAARHRRVAAREAGPNEAFAWPDRPTASPAPSTPASDRSAAAAASVPDVGAQTQVEPGPVESRVAAEWDGADVESHAPATTTVLADPADHDFFSATDVAPAEVEPSRKRVSAEAAFKVVIVIWAIAALGVLAVLLRIALG